MLKTLTFTSINLDGTHNLWSPERPERYGDACAMGRDYAAELLAFISETGDASIFGGVVRAITTSGRYEAVEIGFCSLIGIHLVGLGVSKPKPVIDPMPEIAAAA